MNIVISEPNLTRGQSIRVRRVAKCWRQADLAAFAGVGRSEVSHMELDQRVRPNAVLAVLECLEGASA